MPALAARIAAFTSGLTLDTLPADVVEIARTCLFNAYGIALCGLDTPYAPVARAAALAMEGVGDATLLGDGRRTGIGSAALANAALFHGRAQEDTTGAAHFGTVLVPLLTALIEARGLPLADFIPALVAGYEAGGLLEQALGPRTTPAGHRATAVYGTIAAAAATARLFRLDGETTASGIACAASFTGGVLQSFADASDEWRYQPGIAARNGWTATELARAGAVTAPHAFEGRTGLARAFAGVDLDVEALGAKLGRQWAIHRVTFKPHPVCAFNQTPVTAALRLRDRLAGAGVAAVRVRMNPFAAGYAGMDATGPFTTVSGTLMSTPFCVATTLLHGAPTMARMRMFDDPAITALIDRITLVADADVPILSAVIEADAAESGTITIDQRMTEIDYRFGRDPLRAMLLRIADEQGIAADAIERLEHFCWGLPEGEIATVIDLFAATAQRN